MRLHHLSITAFGPFVEATDVDFDRLSDAGLFLLSGATGAGKSSVLDAVCFALYGAIPGDRNHAGRLRSDQAPAGLAPQVTLEATLSGRRFRIVRSPAWERPKKRGAGTTREPAKVTLSERVDAEWRPLSSRLDETGDLVSGLVGMNLDQFCQVALLPQGQFQAFLRADSAQRHQLLARLFRTGRFERVEAWLREERLTLRRASDRHVTAVADLVSRVSEAAAATVPDQVADPSSASDAATRVWAGSLREQAESLAATADGAVEAVRRAEAHAGAALTQGRDLAAARARVSEAASVLDRLAERADEHALERERLERARRAEGLRPLARLVGERAARASEAAARAASALDRADRVGLDPRDLPAAVEGLSHQLAALSTLLPSERRLADLRAHEESHAASCQRLHRDAELADAESAALSSTLVVLEAALAEATDALRRLPELEAETERARAASVARAEVTLLTAELAGATTDHDHAVHHLLDLREELLDLRERRVAGMAAELAGALAVGHDCPVCGSAEHPRPAVSPSGHPDAEAEKLAQRVVDDAQAVEHALDLRVRELTTALETARTAVGDADADQLQEALADRERSLAEAAALAARHPDLSEQHAAARDRCTTLEEEATARRVQLAELAAALEHLRDEAAVLDAAVSAARGSHPALASAVQQLEERQAVARGVQEAAAARDATEAALAEAEVSWGRAALEAGFDGVDEARAAELASDDLARLDRQVRDHDAALAAARRVLDEPASADLLSTAVPDVAALEAAHREAVSALQRARAAHEAALRAGDRVCGLADDLVAALDRWAPLRERLELATSVSSFAEGKAADNRLQMRLSAYVLAHRLSQVVAAANARLAGMSDQRYSLEHVGRRGAGESRGGLSLVVRDDWSGESRDPATLSGGETFVVSLALALGLADVVAHEAGGADLATLFVDEGFGSLDAETLDDVLDILDTLRENGRAVGVVSHVAEMRDRIPTQLDRDQGAQRVVPADLLLTPLGSGHARSGPRFHLAPLSQPR